MGVIGIVAALVVAAAAAPRPSLKLRRASGAKPLNVVFILTDDHRHDALGFVRPKEYETPALDRLAAEGIHLPNAYVTTALCSPSRATILTGHYAHRHGVVDNNNPVPPGTVFFPQYLQAAGYQTAYIGKWHMGGDSDAPQPGFDRWVSFRGQGTYLPSPNGLNVDGKRVPQKGYISDELTDYALDWLGRRDPRRPFFLYLSHKGVHAEFTPADRHRGRFKDRPFSPPKSMDPALAADPGRPMWVKNQRASWHGTDFAYHGRMDVPTLYRGYAETLLAVDDSVGRVAEYLRGQGLLDSTVVIYMGDNGFALGEHGLIDKRTAYDESMRVPLVVRWPGGKRAGGKITNVVANLDIAPTVLEAAGLVAPAGLDGQSLVPLVDGRPVKWRDALLYEYFWERNLPHTPTMHAVRTARWKYIRYQGLWDIDELFDMQDDPLELRNLALDPQHGPTVTRLNRQLFDLLESTGGMQIPLLRDRGRQSNLRRPGVRPADFPPALTGGEAR